MQSFRGVLISLVRSDDPLIASSVANEAVQCLVAGFQVFLPSGDDQVKLLTELLRTTRRASGATASETVLLDALLRRVSSVSTAMRLLKQVCAAVGLHVS